MYIRITSKCSMDCPHCCYGCNTRDGEHMPLRWAMKALQMCKAYDFCGVALGGGEPTLHPNFREILLEAISLSDPEDSPLLVVTNGTVKKNALLLAKLAKGGVIHAEMSTDGYHDVGMISHEVWEAFGELEHGFRDSADSSIVGQGSAIINNLAAPGRRNDLRRCDYWQCACEGTHFQPNGLVTWCGCKDSPVTGTIASGSFYPTHSCWRNAEDEGEEDTLFRVMTLPINQTWKASNYEDIIAQAA